MQRMNAGRLALFGLAGTCLQTTLLAQTIGSQTPPNPGELLNRPPLVKPSTDNGRNAGVLQPATKQEELPSNALTRGVGQVMVTSFTIDSDIPATLINNEALLAELQGLVDREVSLRELQVTVGKLDAVLKSKYGLIQSKAWLPVQDVKNGVVAIKILKGTVAAIRLGATISAGQVADGLLQIANAHLKAGQALKQLDLETVAYRATDYYGGVVRIVLVPSTRLGDYDVLLEPSAQKKLSGFIGADNTGSPYTSQWHDSWGLRFRDVSGNGDTIALSGQLLTQNQRSVQIRYQRPTVQGWLLGGARQYADYALCCNFASLDLQGSSTTTSVDVTKSLVRSRALSIRVGGLLQRRELRSNMSTNVVFDRAIESASIKADIDWSDEADHSIQASLTKGKISLSKNLNDFNQDAATAKVHGQFNKLLISYAHVRPLPQGLRLRVGLTGQLTDKNLDSSEKLSLGGLSGVRAYPYGEAMSDQALLGQVELSRQVSEQWHFGIFYDWGRAQRNRKPWGGISSPNVYNLQGVGLSSTWQPLPQLNVQMVFAAKLDSNPGASASGSDADGRDSFGRTWIQAVWSF